MGDINKNVNLTFTTKDKASAGLKNIAKEMNNVTESTKKNINENARLTTSLGGISKSFASLTGLGGGLSSSLSGIATKFGLIGAAIGLSLKWFQEFNKLAKEGITEYLNSEKAIAQLNQATEHRSRLLIAHADIMQKVSLYEDDAIIGAMALSAAFIKDEQSLIKINKAAADFASARGVDLATATDLITKSVASGTNAMGRYGIAMSKSSDEGVRLDSILRSINDSYGGMSEAMTRTDFGRVQQLNNEYKDMAETVGKKLTPLMIKWKEITNSIVKYSIVAPVVGLADASSITSKNLERINNYYVKGLGTAAQKLIDIKDEFYKQPETQRVEYLQEEIDKLKELSKEYQGIIKERESKSGTTPAGKKRTEFYKGKLEANDSLISEVQSMQDKLVENKVSLGISIMPTEEEKKELEDYLKDFEKKRLEAQKSLNDELFKLDQEALSITFEGKLKALEYSLDKEKEKYKQQYSDGYIGLAEYYQAATALGDAYLTKKEELIDEEIKKNKVLLDAENKLIEDRAKNRLEVEEYISKTIKSVEEENGKNRLSLKATYEDRQKELDQRSLEGRLDNNLTAFQEEIALFQFMLDEKIIAQEEYNQLSSDMQKEYSEKEMELRIESYTTMSDTITGIASTLASNVNSIVSLTSQKELDDIDEVTEARKTAANMYIKNKKLLAKELAKIDKEAEQKKKEAAKNEQKMALIMSIINTAQAVSGALTMKPPPLGIAMAIIVGALGAVQAGIIASQAFAQGGIIQPEAGVPRTGDKTMVGTNPGEMVINQRQQRNLLAMANGYGGGGGISINETIVVQGNMDSTAIQELKDHREEWLEMLRDSNKQLKYRGYTYAT